MNPKRVVVILVVVVAILAIDAEVLNKDQPVHKADITGQTNPSPPSSVPTSTKNTGNATNATSALSSPKTGVRGAVTLGPVCPVERIPPDPKCAPKSFGTSIGIYTHNVLVSFVKTDDNGIFVIDLPPGTYTFDPAGGNPYPSCRSETVTVPSAGYVTLNLSCDTGIR